MTIEFHQRLNETDHLPVAGAPKLGVVIPALDEEATIGKVVAAVPRRILGVGDVEVIVVDDGSSDATRDLALAAGADRIVVHRRNRGLVPSFNHGISMALARGCDVVVHLDADGQHDPAFIPGLIRPILTGEADLVVGVRPLTQAAAGTPVRRYGNRLVSWLFRRTFKVQVRDVTSGYRAFSREALLQLNVVTDYTYTLESLIQAARKRLAVAEVGIPAHRRQVGESRVTHSVRRYIHATGGQAFRTTLHSAPLLVFGRAAIAFFVVAAAFTTWFLLGYADGGMHLPALLASVFSLILGVGLFVSGLIADGVQLEPASARGRALQARTARGAGRRGP